VKSREQIVIDVNQALSKLLQGKELKISSEMKLISDYGLESIDILDLLFEIEQTTGISINLSEAFSVQRKDQGQGKQFDLSIDEIVDYLLKNQ
jgi:acyl carrier protein